MAKVFIPTVFRQHVGGADSILLEGEKIKDILNNLTTQYPLIKPYLYNEDNKLRSFVNIYVNDDDIRYQEQEETLVKENDEITIIPSIAGG